MPVTSPAVTSQRSKWLLTLLLTLFTSVLWSQDFSLLAPAELTPSRGAKLVLHAQAQGYQVYTCKAQNAQYSWVFKQPEADLFDESGKSVGYHFAGPSWQLSDKSQVTGKLVASVNSTDTEAIPWLLLTAVNHSGSGLMARVTDIQRLNTSGGAAPDTGCDAQHIGVETRVPYTADYYFFGK